jgi:hypothetical protein
MSSIYVHDFLPLIADSNSPRFFDTQVVTTAPVNPRGNLKIADGYGFFPILHIRVVFSHIGQQIGVAVFVNQSFAINLFVFQYLFSYPYHGPVIGESVCYGREALLAGYGVLGESIDSAICSAMPANILLDHPAAMPPDAGVFF